MKIPAFATNYVNDLEVLYDHCTNKKSLDKDALVLKILSVAGRTFALLGALAAVSALFHGALLGGLLLGLCSHEIFVISANLKPDTFAQKISRTVLGAERTPDQELNQLLEGTLVCQHVFNWMIS